MSEQNEEGSGRREKKEMLITGTGTPAEDREEERAKKGSAKSSSHD